LDPLASVPWYFSGTKDLWREGNSSKVVVVELAQPAQVKRLALSHYDPVLDDRIIDAVLADTVRFEAIKQRGGRVEAISAYDGLELIV
jgi:hypothetical protein